MALIDREKLEAQREEQRRIVAVLPKFTTDSHLPKFEPLETPR
jgi:hypothetical protein